MIKEAIILAGGLGTRLKSVVADLPKCMAPVAGKPFLHFVIKHLQQQGIEKFIFSVGYKHEAIENYLNKNHPELNYKLALETEPLGTGGAIKLAGSKATEQDVLVLNGDTLFTVDVKSLYAFHQQHQSVCTLALKPMSNFNRYGVVELNNDNRVASFKEKQQYKTGNISAGVYILNIANFISHTLPEKFSIEKDFLEKFYTTEKMYGCIQDKYFIDIGIPEDYSKAQTELVKQLLPVDTSWTLFLDRDGVINHEKHKDYIHTWDEFVFYEGAEKAIAKFSAIFGQIIIVTNQRGVGKGVTKKQNLEIIHQNMKAAVEKGGGKIDAIYYCPDTDDSSPNRKPNPGMGLQAKKDFPAIDFQKSIMVGNTLSDMKFGRNLTMAATIFLTTTRPEVDTADNNIDAAFPSLLSFAEIF